MVEYIDNSIIAQLSVPDMRFCIQYALSYPDKLPAVIKPLRLSEVGTLSFGRPDYDTFPLLSAALTSAEKGGALPAVLNASNEVAVESFLKGEIKFPTITETVMSVLSALEGFSLERSLDGILAADNEARRTTAELLKK